MRVYSIWSIRRKLFQINVLLFLFVEDFFHKFVKKGMASVSRSFIFRRQEKFEIKAVHKILGELQNEKREISWENELLSFKARMIYFLFLFCSQHNNKEASVV